MLDTTKSKACAIHTMAQADGLANFVNGGPDDETHHVFNTLTYDDATMWVAKPDPPSEWIPSPAAKKNSQRS